MNTNAFSCNFEEIKRRQTDLVNNLNAIRNVLMGLEYPLDKMILKQNRLDSALIDSVIDEILLYTECVEEMEQFYRELYYCAILYLYTVDLRKSDIILLSVFKIAATFDYETTKNYFNDTTFGIMLSDIWDGSESVKMGVMTDEQSVSIVLKQHATHLERIYDNINSQFSAADVVRNAIEIYAAVHGWSTLSNEVKYNSAISSIINAQHDAQFLMRKGSDF